MFLPVTVHFRTVCNRTVPTRDVLLPDHLLWITCPRPGLFILWTIKWSPFCACAVHNVDHLPPGSSYCRSFSPGQFILLIICPRAVHTADHFPGGSSYCRSFSPGQFILWISCPRAVHTMDRSFCPRTVHTLDQLPRTVHTLDQLSQDSSYSEPFAPVPFTACPLTAP